MRARTLFHAPLSRASPRARFPSSILDRLSYRSHTENSEAQVRRPCWTFKELPHSRPRGGNGFCKKFTSARVQAARMCPLLKLGALNFKSNARRTGHARLVVEIINVETLS